MSTIKKLFWALSEAMVRVTVVNSHRDQRTGSAFHLGRGYFATARHVLDDAREIQLSHCPYSAMIDRVDVVKTIVPEREEGDVAVLKTKVHFTDYHLTFHKGSKKRALESLASIPFGPLVDEAVSDNHILDEVLLMGYPRVPLSRTPELLAVRGEVNASLIKYLDHGYYVHIISTMARGGFSGGPVIDEHGFLIGIFSESLMADHPQEELGYAAAISIEPLLLLLKRHRIVFTDNYNILLNSQVLGYDEWYENKKERTLGLA